MKNIEISDSLQIEEKDSPFRIGERVKTEEEILSIPSPFVGELVYVCDTNRYYTIEEVEDKIINGVVYPSGVSGKTIIPKGKVKKYSLFTGSGNIKKVKFGEVEVEDTSDSGSILDLGNQSKDLITKSLYQNTINVTDMTGKTYTSPEEAQLDLAGTLNIEDQELGEGAIRVYKETSSGKWCSWILTNRGWKEISDITKGAEVEGGVSQYLYSELASLEDIMREVDSSTAYSDIALFDSLYPSTQALEIIGDSEIPGDLKTFLVKDSTIIGELKENNWLRYKDDTFAPVIVNKGGSNEYETEVDLGYDIMQGWTYPIYVIPGTIGNSGKKIYGLWKVPVEYDGVMTVKVEPTLVSPGPACVINLKARSVYSEDALCPGKSGIAVYTVNSELLNVLSPMLEKNVPVVGMTIDKARDYCSVRNSTTQSVTPYSVEMHVQQMLRYYVAYYQHSRTSIASLFGYGVSEDPEVELGDSTWGTITGWRYRFNKNGDWTYTKSNFLESYYAYPSNLASEPVKVSKVSDIFSYNGYLFKTLEPQMALSWATENKIEPGTEFDFYGETWYYENIPGLPELLASGEMNAKVFKKFETTDFNLISDPDEDTRQTIAEIQGILEFPIIRGSLLWGSGYETHNNEGLECVVDIYKLPTKSETIALGNDINFYLQTKQSGLRISKTVTSVSEGEGFKFTDIYQALPKFTDNIYKGYIMASYPFCGVPKSYTSLGGQTYECSLFKQGIAVKEGWGTSNLEIGKRKLAIVLSGTKSDEEGSSRCLSYRSSRQTESEVLAGFLFQQKI